MDNTTMLLAAAAASFAVNAFFVRRLIQKVDRVADALFNGETGVMVRLAVLERGVAAPLVASLSVADRASRSHH